MRVPDKPKRASQQAPGAREKANYTIADRFEGFENARISNGFSKISNGFFAQTKFLTVFFLTPSPEIKF